jgi:hypothetical protein
MRRLDGGAGALGVADALVGEMDKAVIERPAVDEAHGLLGAGLAEEALAITKYDRVDHKPQFVD